MRKIAIRVFFASKGERKRGIEGKKGVEFVGGGFLGGALPVAHVLGWAVSLSVFFCITAQNVALIDPRARPTTLESPSRRVQRTVTRTTPQDEDGG